MGKEMDMKDSKSKACLIEYMFITWVRNSDRRTAAAGRKEGSREWKVAIIAGEERSHTGRGP